MTTREILEEAKALISDEKNWASYPAIRGNGPWCAMGAVYQVIKNSEGYYVRSPGLYKAS